MMYFQQGADQKGIRVFSKRGLSWVSVGHRDTWGKLDGVWRRGTAQEVLVVLDPPVRTLYWDYNLWELLGRPAEELNVQILVGRNAVLCGSLHPTDPKPALDLAGGWALTTKFDVYLHGMLVGASGWGGEPPLMRPDLLPINGREVAANHAATCVTNATVVDYGRSSGAMTGLYSPEGNIYGQLFPRNPGGRGGDCLRANRQTTLHIMEGADYIGMVLPGGGGGASMASYWRRFVGRYRLYLSPNTGGLSGSYTVPGKYKQWSLAGWGGAAGAGANVAFQKAGPEGHPYKISFATGLSPTAPENLDAATCLVHGRAVPPFNRQGLDSVASIDGVTVTAPATHPALNAAGRTASSGRASGSDVYMAPLSELAASGRIMPNDIESVGSGALAFNAALQGSLSAADYAKIRGKYQLFKVPFARNLRLYERRDFKGGIFASPEYAFDKLCNVTMAAGAGGQVASAGSPGAYPTLNAGEAISKYAQAWSDTGVFGFSTFVFSRAEAAVQAPPGRAIVGSEYVTVVGRQLAGGSSPAFAKNWAGASVPFE